MTFSRVLESSVRNRMTAWVQRDRRVAKAIMWLAAVAIAVFYIHRSILVTPLPLDSPGTLRPTLYSWFRFYSGLFANNYDAYSAWHAACYVVLLSVPLLALLNYLWKRNAVHLPVRYAGFLLSPGVFWTVYAICLSLCRYPVLLRNELNPDEGQFLASACKLFYDPNYFHSVDCHTSGPGNIFPLMLPALFGLSPDFASSRVVALIALFLSAYLLYRSVTLLASEAVARIAVLPVALAFPVFGNSELVYHSSEHLPMLLVSLALFLSTRILVRPDAYRAPAFLLGLTASTAFFTKLQSVPIVAATVAVPLAYLLFAINYRAARHALLLVAAGVCPPVLSGVALCVRAGVFQDFWQSYVISNVAYTDSPLALDVSIRSFCRWATETRELRAFFITVVLVALAWFGQKLWARFRAGAVTRFQILAPVAAAAALAFIPSDHRDLILTFMPLAAACLVPVYFLLQSRRRPLREDPVRWFGLLALLSSEAAVFAVYGAHHGFIHYLLFLFVPLGMVAAWMLASKSGRNTILPYLTISLTAVSTAYLWKFQDSRAFEIPFMIRAPEGDFIRSVTSPGGRIYVWGWTALPYLASGRIPATRQTLVGTLFRSYNVLPSPPVFQPTPGLERVTAYYRGRELHDLQANRPELFIDAIGPASWFLLSRQYFGFDRVPEIAAFVDANYVHLVDLYRERYFLRRDVAARREAEFNRPLPPKVCEAASIRCLDTPVTLPRELPPVKMPAHARIEAEFMPIRSQIGVATVFNNEAQPNSFRGFRLQHVVHDRYIFLLGLGDRWAVSREFELPEGRAAFVTIELDRRRVRISNNGLKVDEMHLERPAADAPGPVTIGSWIQGMDPFSGKIQFFQIVDLERSSNIRNY